MVLQTLNKKPPPVLHMVYLNIASRNTKMLHNYRRLLYSEPQEAKSDAFSHLWWLSFFLFLFLDVTNSRCVFLTTQVCFCFAAAFI